MYSNNDSLKKIFLKVHSSTSRLSTQYMDCCEPVDKTARTIYLDIYGCTDEDYEEGEIFLIGQLKCIFFDLFSAYYNFSYDELFVLMEDCYDQNVADIFHEFVIDMVENNTNPFREDSCDLIDILYIDSIIIKPEYRNMGIGRKVLEDLDETIDYIFNYRGYVKLLIPWPIEYTEDEDLSEGRGYITVDDDNRRKKLISFYENIGFKRCSKDGKESRKETESKFWYMDTINED